MLHSLWGHDRGIRDFYPGLPPQIHLNNRLNIRPIFISPDFYQHVYEFYKWETLLNNLLWEET